ncbi:UDP-N-acetylmuramoyl-L-alanine--D-glutamate ligase [Cyanobium sp. FACHB-13342]|uniref:UDP-N-acetylmuramoyl-L-alanine--D-glutamate ligase n=1 Tax=Cyanobium sp. FACHB-13342 TaxID=2692793 RepID=UPI0016819AAF|nr:UDP-N-acetylmuramoyl-L-alanine--D-glutamate ligase [Cyanobium sp. FACHB-13342]MBD2423536.1 UDP-N-acetylmuramoyl-L-alanine--D-glutamate ligase [Cyanobium sp. FACHB-13342]
MAVTASDLTVVVGLARSGIGAAKLLRQAGRAVLVIDNQQGPDLEARAADLRQLGIAVQLGAPLHPDTFTALASRPATVVVSPGIRWDHPTLEWLRQQGIPTVGDLELAWQASSNVPWIGITGTNGKTTVTHLVSHLLQHAGLDAPMGGNVGFSAAELVLERIQPNLPEPDWLVMELSSYQIEAAPQVAPQVGIWTTLTPDHLERHGTLEAYRAIKRGLLERSRERILNADDADLQAHADRWERATWITAGPRASLPHSITPSLWIEGGQVMHAGPSGATPLMAADCLAMPGAHNRQNMLLAAAAGRMAGLSGAQMEEAFRAFPGVPHRLERLREDQGITYYNDSKATNYDAAEVALQALAGPLVVLAGGEAKQGDPNSWLVALGQKAAAVVLFGAAQAQFQQLLAAAGFPGAVHCCEGLDTGVALAAQLARTHSCQAVLLSPACASFDQYSDFEARGDHFRRLVSGL